MIRKFLLVGVALALTALLASSCNKNRFDFDQLESVEGSGQWKLPIGSAQVTLGQVMSQLGDNEMVSYDDEGNLQLSYQMSLEKVVKGSSFLNLGTLNFHSENSFENPFPGAVMEPIDTVYRFNQKVELTSDSIGIESAIVKTGEMTLTMITNLGNVSEVVLSSSGIIEPNGDSLVRHFNALNGNTVDLSGATFQLHDPVTGVADSTLTLNYVVHYQLMGINDPTYETQTLVGLNNLRFEEVCGHINSLIYEIEYDTSFSLPLNNVEGQAKLVGANVQINEKNSFTNLYASLNINEAEFYGGGAQPSSIFSSYPYVLQIVPSETWYNVMPEETMDLFVDTRHDAIRFLAQVDLNANQADNLVTIRDNSSIDFLVDAVVPMQFNIPGIYYYDTLNLSFSEIEVPDLVEEIRLSILFDSEMPFNLNGQFYTLSPNGQVTDSLMTNAMHVSGSFDGNPVKTESVISITQERLEHLLESDRLMMRFGVDTDNQDVMLNLDNGMGITLKADVLYGGSVDVNNF